MNVSKQQSALVTRDAAWIEREYGRDKWPPLLDAIDKMTAAGETSLARVVAALRRRDWKFGAGPVNAAAYGESVRLPTEAAMAGYDGLITELVIAACRPDTDVVIELGAGWGRSLFSVWLQGGPRRARYAGLEYTSAGLDCMRSLGALAPDLDLVTAPFDFERPTFPVLGSIRHAVVFSVYALHQVTSINLETYRTLANVAPAMDMLHFEPIGFQISESGALKQRAHLHAQANGYNLDAWKAIDALAKEQMIEIVSVEPDLFGFSDHYPASLVHWRKR